MDKTATDDAVCLVCHGRGLCSAASSAHNLDSHQHGNAYQTDNQQQAPGWCCSRAIGEYQHYQMQSSIRARLRWENSTLRVPSRASSKRTEMRPVSSGSQRYSASPACTHTVLCSLPLQQQCAASMALPGQKSSAGCTVALWVAQTMQS